MRQLLFLAVLVLLSGCGYKAPPYYEKSVIEDKNGTL